MATYSTSLSTLGSDATFNGLFAGDTISYTVNGAGAQSGYLNIFVLSSSGCSVTVSSNNFGENSQTGTISGFTGSNYSVTWRQNRDPEFGGGFETVTLSGTIAEWPIPDVLYSSVVRNISYASIPLVVSGLQAPVSLSVYNSNSTYSKNGNPFTSADSSVVNGDVLIVQHISSSSYSTTRSSTVNIDGNFSTFDTTTVSSGGVTSSPSLQDRSISFPVSPSSGGILATPLVVGPSDTALNIYFSNANPSILYHIYDGSTRLQTVSGATGYFSLNNSQLPANDNTKLYFIYCSETADYFENSAGTIVFSGSGVPYLADGAINVPVVSVRRGESGSVVVTSPTDIDFVIAGINSASTSVTVTASGGTEGTLQVSNDNSTWVINGSSFNVTRGTTPTFYARRLGPTNSAGFSEAVSIPYLASDTSVTATNDTIAQSATSATTIISDGQPDEEYAIRLYFSNSNNIGSVNLGTRVGNGSITFSSSLPSTGSNQNIFQTYEILSRRPIANGGDNVWVRTNDRFIVSRLSANNSPDQFDLGGPVTGAQPSTVVFSNTITVSGVDTSASVTVTGGGSPEYSINNGNYDTVTGSVSNGDTVRIRVTSSSASGESVTATLNIGGVTDTFTVTTLDSSDTTPNAFDLGGPVSGVALSTLVTSNTITVFGIDAASPISISGTGSPTYRKNGGAFTSSAGTVVAGDTVQVRVTSSASNNTSVTAALNIGGLTDTFTVTTVVAGASYVRPIISSVTYDDVSSPTVTATVNLSSTGSGGTLEFAQTTTNNAPSTGWQVSPSFSQPRDTTRYYWASQAKSITGANSVSSLSVPYLLADNTFSFSPQTRTLPFSTTSTTFEIIDGSSHTTYKIQAVLGDNLRGVLGERTGSGIITITDSAPDWPSAGSSVDFIVVKKRTFAEGGDDVYRYSSGDNGFIAIDEESVGIDTTPNAFDLGGPIEDEDPSSFAYSSIVTISGVNSPTPISISGTGSPEYRINTGNYTSNPGSVLNGDTVRIRVTSSSVDGESVTATLNIGEVTDTFTATTFVEPSSVPDAFDLGGPIVDEQLSTPVFSNVITLTGLGASTFITISGGSHGTYSINGGEFTSAFGTVSNNDTVQVKILSSPVNNITLESYLNIGGVTNTFSVTTLASDNSVVTSGNSNYGLEVFGPNGAIVFSPNFKVCNLAVLTAFSLSGGGIADFPCDAAQFANRVVILVDTGSRLANEKITITREFNNIRLTNTSTTSTSGQLVAIRIA